MLVRHTLSVLPFVALAYGGPLVARNPQCNVGSMQCCQSVQSASSPTVSILASLVGELLSMLDGETQLGFQCTSITGAGSGTKCEANPVCCTNTTYHGLINVGCSPLNM